MRNSIKIGLSFFLMSCSSANFNGKAANLAATKGASGTAQLDTYQPATGAGTQQGSTQDSPIKSGDCAVANANASATDPSGVGATFSSDNSGLDSCNKNASDRIKGPLGDPTENTVVIGSAPRTGLTQSQSDSLQSCLKLWGSRSPFSINRTRPDKVIFGNLEVGPANRLIDAVLGTQFSGITDEQVTTKPSLILIVAAVNLAATHVLLPEVTYKFHNPNGWYCVDFGLNIASATKVELKKGAQLADSRFNLSIFSSSPATSAHQVSILSHTDVVTIP